MARFGAALERAAGRCVARQQRSYVRYSGSVEVRQPGEDVTIGGIIAAMQRGAITGERYHHGVRASHAKSHGLLKGEMRVVDNLPEPLRQGLFAAPRIS